MCLYFTRIKYLYTHAEISFFGSKDSIEILPKPRTSLQPLIFLEFPLLPSSLQPENFTSSWTLPSGKTVSLESQSTDTRILAQEGLTSVNATQLFQAAFLLIQGLSYKDAGIYTCRVQDNTNPGSPPIEGTIELRLNCEIYYVNY